MGFRVREALYTVKSALQKMRSQQACGPNEAAHAVCRFRMLLMMLMAHQADLHRSNSLFHAKMFDDEFRNSIRSVRRCWELAASKGDGLIREGSDLALAHSQKYGN